MKRLFSVVINLFLIISILLTACTVTQDTPEIPCDFTQNAKVTSGDFSFNCTVRRDAENVKVSVLNTYAKGLVMTFDGENIAYNFEDFDYNIAPNNQDKNIAVIIWSVLNQIDAGSVKIKVLDSGFAYSGEVNSYAFYLKQKADFTIDYIEIKSLNIKVEFV